MLKNKNNSITKKVNKYSPKSSIITKSSKSFITNSKPHRKLSPLISKVNINTKHINSLSHKPFSTTTMSSPTPTLPTTPNTLRVALCQISVTPNKEENYTTASNAITTAVTQGAKLIVLPECFQCPYDTSAFPLYQEPIPNVDTIHNDINTTESPTTKFLSQLAIKHNIYIVGGSIPEKTINEDGTFNTYNTSITFNNQGTIVAKHRKLHLFDIDIPGKITFRESDSLTPGNQITTFKFPTNDHFINNLTPNFRSELTIAVGICYDIRFSEYALIARQQYNADVIIYPGAFNMTTGPAHWELLSKSRAVDNQMYVLSCSPARSIPNDPKNVNQDGKPYTYVAWGHSTAVGPWGDILSTTEHDSDIVIADLDMNRMDEIREQIPISKQRKNDLYGLYYNGDKQ